MPRRVPSPPAVLLVILACVLVALLLRRSGLGAGRPSVAHDPFASGACPALGRHVPASWIRFAFDRCGHVPTTDIDGTYALVLPEPRPVATPEEQQRTAERARAQSTTSVGFIVYEGHLESGSLRRGNDCIVREVRRVGASRDVVALRHDDIRHHADVSLVYLRLEQDGELLRIRRGLRIGDLDHAGAVTLRRVSAKPTDASDWHVRKEWGAFESAPPTTDERPCLPSGLASRGGRYLVDLEATLEAMHASEDPIQRQFDADAILRHFVPVVVSADAIALDSASRSSICITEVLADSSTELRLRGRWRQGDAPDPSERDVHLSVSQLHERLMLRIAARQADLAATAPLVLRRIGN